MSEAEKIDALKRAMKRITDAMICIQNLLDDTIDAIYGETDSLWKDNELEKWEMRSNVLDMQQGKEEEL